ncbi:MAG: tRNA 2-selenouridine(34) synthase MnmH [Bacteroidota bacterium]|nr:tRNA 2-selenouridine(34) synthase MnmH [Bacteroidota bacterium]
MPIEQIDIEKFLELSKTLPVIDVRSPGEYLHAHIPNAISIPLFTDEQRKIIGTAYKNQSRQIAVNIGLNYFSERMKIIPAEVINILKDWEKAYNNNTLSSSSSGAKGTGLLIHCWRGGMRSEAVAWLLNLYGYKIYVLKGGYKAFRNWALTQFEKKYSFKILGGFTGSGKTDILKEIRKEGKAIIDLESLANHKGSAFGALGEKSQPAQEMFENLIAVELWKNTNEENTTNGDEQTQIDNPAIWLEDESSNIGKVNIPKILWTQMRNSPLYFLEIPFEERLNYIVSVYGNFTKKDLVTSIMQLQKRLGGLETKNAINFLLEDKPKDSFSILMQYYDKMYFKGLHNRENEKSLLTKIYCSNVDRKNAQYLL